MFKMQKHKSHLKYPRDKLEFKFTDFNAINVPKGWDKLFVYMVSVETGKTASKSGKTSVRNGICSWTETFSESIYINHLGFGTCVYKFLVAMGSSRSGILGEVSVDLANFASTTITSTPLSFPLQKCQYGTSLQFRVQCLTPITKNRDVQKKEASMGSEYVTSDYDDMETKSDASDAAFSTNSSSHLESASISQAALSRDPSFSASDSHHSTDSLETSSLKDVHNGNGNGNEKEQNCNAIASSPLSNIGSSKELLEAAKVTMEELRAEARMWERNSKKLSGDVNLLKNEVSEQSGSQETLAMELSASQQEIEHLKGLLEKSAMKSQQETTEIMKIRAMDMDEIKRQMEEEIHLLKESNADLTVQLGKTQESNIELLSILQELEGIVETQKSEIDNLSSQKPKLQESANLDSIKLELQQLQDTQEELESAIKLLEKTVEEKDDEIESLHDLREQALLESDSTWSVKVAAKEEEIVSLEKKLAEAVKNCENKESETAIMVREIDSLTRKVEDLEENCNELTEDLERELGTKEALIEELEIQLETFKQKKDHLEDELQAKCIEEEREEQRNPEVEALKSNSLLKEEEISGLLKKISILKDQIENLEREKALSSESIEELKREITELSNSVESHASASKKFQRQSSELGKGKQDVENQLSEIEKENIQMSERITTLEAKLRFLTNEEETCYLELQNSEAQLVNLRDEITRLKTEMDANRVDFKQRLEEMRARWLESQEERNYLKKDYPKLKSTAENLTEECNSLGKLNGELKRQNLEMHTRCTLLESQLKDSKGRFVECLQKIDALEAEFSNMLEEVSLKEKGLNSELDSLIVEDKIQKEKLMNEHISLNDMYSRKVFEVENLQRELAHLIDQIFVADGEKDSILKLSSLHAEKATLEASLLELQGKFADCREKLSNLESEYEGKVQDLSRELTASRKIEQVLMADCDNLEVQLESSKSNSEKYKSTISELEINLKASEYERQQLDNEISSLKNRQIQRATLLQDELVDVKTCLSDAKFEHERMKASLEVVRGEYEELKTGNEFLLQKVSNVEKALLELEDCKRREKSLQENFLRLEGDLAAREKLCAQDAELKFELSKIKRTNSELQRKIKYLEQDERGLLDKIHALEQQLKQKKNQTTRDNPSNPTQPSESIDDFSKVQSVQYQLAEALEANNMYKSQLRTFSSEEPNNPSDTLHTSGDFEIVSSLEIELSDLRERYFEMSLKYAEVEAQREELVRKLKSRNNTTWGWFSK